MMFKKVVQDSALNLSFWCVFNWARW